MAKLQASIEEKWIDGIEYRKQMKERADCVVRSVATVLGMSYSSAHSLVKSHGRRNKQGTSWTTLTKLIDRLTEEDTIKSVPTKKYYKSTGRLRKMRMSTFAKEYPRGRYIVFVAGHMTSLIDGTYIETGGSNRPSQRIDIKDQYVRSAWEVEK